MRYETFKLAWCIQGSWAMRISMTRCAARSVPAIVALFAAPASRDSRAIAVCTSLYFVEAGFPIPICMFRYIHHPGGQPPDVTNDLAGPREGGPR